MRRLCWIVRILCAAGAIVLPGSRAEAATCSISTTAVAFGTYDVFSVTSADTTGTISFSCNGNARNIVITLSKGASTTFNPRAMAGPSDTLDYNLYSDAARSTIWGDGTGSTSTYTNASPPNNSTIVVTIFARAAAGQDVRAGTYTDTVTAIINF